MNIQNIIETLKSNAGRNIHAEWTRACKTLKSAVGVVVEKRVSCAVRGGIDYANLRSVRDGIANGERDEVAELPWGSWAQFPIHIVHTPRGATSQVDYVRLYPASGFGGIQKPKTQWFLNGAPVEFSAVEHYLLASEKPQDDEAAECFNIKAESLVALGSRS